jgi:hypothetical protein
MEKHPRRIARKISVRISLKTIALKIRGNA